VSERVELVSPTPELRAEFLDLARDHATAGDDRYAAALDDFDAYLARLQAIERGEELPPGDVPCSSFWLVAGGRVVAVSRLRHGLTPELEREGGHIGYDVRPSARRRGHGTRLLGLVLERAHARGLRHVLLTCDDDNLASARIIESNGGRLQDVVPSPEGGQPLRRYWIEVPRALARRPSALSR
jgi:predicted acetyltransferase